MSSWWASNEDLGGTNQKQQQAFTSPVGQTRLVARNVAPVAAETLCQTCPVHQNKTQYKLFDLLFNSPMTDTHLPDSGNTWIVVYPLLGVNTHTGFHFSFLLCLCIFTAHMLSIAFYRFLDLFLKILFHLFILLNNKHGNYLLCLLHHEFLC